MKRILGLLLIVSMTLSLVGCTNPDTELYNALEKMQEVTSLESETEISFQFKGEGLDEATQMEINQAEAFLNNFKITLNQKAVGNEEQTKAQTEADVNVDFGGMSMGGKMWADVDLEATEIKTIIQLPSMLMASMGPEGLNKEYMIYDIGKIMKAEDEDFDFAEIMEVQKEFQAKLIKYAKDIEEDIELDFEIIQLKEEKEVDGEKIKVYELKLDDEALKELLKELVNNALENPATKEFIVDYMNNYMDTMMTMGLEEELNKEELEEMKEEMKSVEEELDENLKEFKEEFNKFMETYKDVKVLGEKGINVEYSINKAGYVVETNGVIDISLNLEEISKAMEEEIEEYPASKGTVNFTINYNTKNNKINSKDIKIEFPEVNEENSFDFLEMMEEQMKQMEEMQQIQMP